MIFPPELELGKYTLAAHSTLDCTLLASLTGTPPVAGCLPEDLLYWDTETTGLGGSGSLVFLVGTLKFTNKGALIRQYLLPEPAREPEFLEMVLRELENCRSLVSYNGRAFDSHAVKTRCIMNRFPEPAQGPHLDLIYPSRNAYRQTLEDCTLKRIEKEILNIQRPPGDIPGALIPAQYAAWLESRNRKLLEPILEHNRYDLLSLAMLAVELTQTLAESPESLPPRGLALLALKIEKSGDSATAAALLEKAFDHSRSKEDKLRTGMLLKKRYYTGDTARLHNHLKRLYLETGRSVPAAIEWAKQLEHRERKITEAIRVVQEAAGITDDERLLPALQHRLDRLLKKRRALSALPGDNK